MRCKRRLKIRFPFKIRPRIYLVLKIKEEIVKKQKRRDRRRRRMKTKLKKKIVKRTYEYYILV